MYLSLYLEGFEKVVWGSTVRGCWRSNITAIFWPHCYDRWCSTGGLGAHSAGWWLSWLHLISHVSGPQTYHTSSYSVRSPRNSNSTGTRTQLNYIIVRRPLDLWNRMFNRRQAEITVMQFTGHSLPMRQSMSVPWEFFLAPPISSANFRPGDFLT